MSRSKQESSAEVLRASEARQAAILATALDCIVTIDHTGRVLDFNPAAERTFGYSRAEAVGREMAELIIPPHLRERHRHGIQRATETGRDTIAGQRIEITAMRKCGEEFPVELAITRIVVECGPPLFTGHIRDITARRRTEQRLAAQYAVTHVLAEAATLAEATPRLLRAVCEGLGWDLGALWRVESEADALRCVDLWHVEGVPLAEFVAATRGEVFARGVGLPGRIWAEDAPLWIEDAPQAANFPRLAVAVRCGLHGAFGFPVRLGENVLGVVEFFSREIRQPDVELLDMFTAIGSQLGQFIERRRAEEELRALNVDLERRIRERTMELAEANVRLLETLEREQELGQLKSNFVSLVSHEFRTPLGVILSSAEMLQRYFARLGEGERQEYLRSIHEAVQRMAELMEEVLVFNKVEAGMSELNAEPLDLAALCRRIADEVASSTGHRCPIACEFGRMSTARADERLLRHILINVLNNAVKYSEPGAPVKFAVKRSKDGAVCVIRDQGIGIPAEDLATLFVPFRRGGNVGRRAGTGLGLAIAKRCVDLHGGTIDFKSEIGAGTTVTVRLPLFARK